MRGISRPRRSERPSASVRNDLLRQLAARVAFDVPEALVEREIERRIEEFVAPADGAGGGSPAGGHRLAAVPRHASAMPARETVASAHRPRRSCAAGKIAVTESGEVDAEIDEVAAATGRTGRRLSGHSSRKRAVSPAFTQGYGGRRRLTSCRSRATIAEGVEPAELPRSGSLSTPHSPRRRIGPGPSLNRV